MHKCTTECVQFWRVVCGDSLYFDGHPSSKGSPLDFWNAEKNTKEWLLKNPDIFTSGNCKTLKNSKLYLIEVTRLVKGKECSAVLKNLIEKVEAKFEAQEEIGFRTPSKFNPVAKTGEICRIDRCEGTIEFHSGLFRPFKDVEKCFWIYEFEVVKDLVACLQENDTIIWRTRNELKRMASLAQEIGFLELAECIWERLLEQDVKQCLKILEDNPEAPEDDMRIKAVISRFCKNLKFFSSNDYSKLSPQHVRRICFNACWNEDALWTFINDYWAKKKSKEEIDKLGDLENFFRFENTHANWFDSQFIKENPKNKLRHLLSEDQATNWSQYLNGKGELPIPAARDVRETDPKKTEDIPILPITLEKWYPNRPMSFSIVSATYKLHFVDRCLFQENWIHAINFSCFSDEAIEDFIRALYGVPFESWSFQTLTLLHACGLIDECNLWMTGKAQKYEHFFVEDITEWLDILPKGLRLPRRIILEISFNLKRLLKVIHKIPRKDFLYILTEGNLSLLTPEQMWELVELYSKDPEFQRELIETVKDKTDEKFCTLLKEKGILSSKKHDELYKKRIKKGICPFEGYKLRLLFDVRGGLSRMALFSSKTRTRHIFAIRSSKQIVDRCSSQPPKWNIVLEIIYEEGPPCVLEIFEGHNLIKMSPSDRHIYHFYGDLSRTFSIKEVL